MTLARYYTIVAVSYFAMFLAIALVGGLADSPDSLQLWCLPFAGAGTAIFVTWAVMGRFGNAGGSIYFAPTVIHAAMLMVLVVFVGRVPH